jgi:hypothetical protein
VEVPVRRGKVRNSTNADHPPERAIRPSPKLQRRLAVTTALGALAWLLTTLLIGGNDPADKVSSVISGAVLLISVVAGAGPRTAASDAPNLGLDQLRRPAEQRVSQQVRQRGLIDKPFLPVRLTSVRAAKPGAADTTRTGCSWPEYGKAISRRVGGSLVARLVHGDRGCGKSTAALAVTVTRLANPHGRLPLLLSLSSWNPAAEDLETWLDRNLGLVYSAYRRLGPDGGDRLTVLLREPVEFVLDGLDELASTGYRRDALDQTIDLFRNRCPVMVFASELLPGAEGDRPLLRLAMGGPDRADSGAYLDRVFREAGDPLSRRPEIRRREAELLEPLVDILGSVFYLDLFRTLLLGGTVTLADINDALWHGGPPAVRSCLLDAFVAGTVATLTGRHRRHGVRWLRSIAAGMTSRKVTVLPWWRIHDALPSWVLPAMLALGMIPAYLLALVLPAGLTRGFGLGSVVGIGLGLMRGVDHRGRDLLPATAVVAAIVLAIGTVRVGAATAVIDTAEIAVAFLLALRWRGRLLLPWPDALAAILVISFGSAMATWAAQTAMGVSDRTFIGVFLAVALGVGVAVLAARLLTMPSLAIRPSSLSLSVSGRGWPGQDIAFGILAGTAVGLAGGLVGGITRSLHHGVQVAVVFGLVVGLPVGAIGGLFSWLNRPGTEHALATPRTTNRRDMVAALAAIVFIAAAADASIELLRGPLRTSVEVRPIHGVLFGMTISVIVACFNTAWPTYVAAHLWFALGRQVPWRFIRFLDALCDRQVLRQEGATYQFRNAELQEHLADRARSRRSPGRHCRPQQQRTVRTGE